MDAETRRNYIEFEYMRMLDRIDAKAAGVNEGIEIGQREDAIKTLVSLVSEGALPIDVAIKHSGLTEQEFRKQLEMYKDEETS